MSWRSESPFTVGFRAYVGFWFHCSPNPKVKGGNVDRFAWPPIRLLRGQLAISTFWQAAFSVGSALGSHHGRLLCDAISLYQYPDRI
ncbi:MAG: hypothetical protein E2594_01320 [Pseudomonas sp.]|nr:hypothetical protein [Stutzerimonas frequens]MBK3872650.1 hypothetical protein [Stutzerimonas frequens]MBK3910921.1 hypothetical protein [Stutzerimonas frequens]MBK3930203.1 hypothetical protein [Stutzerimonas frequens]MPS55779.1 hypothetical protein [Pseudomonas sp.]